MDMSDRIKQRMSELEVKGVDITKATGVSSGGVSQWVNGITEPSGANLVSLSKILQCDPEWLSDGMSVRETGVTYYVGEVDKGEIPVISYVQAGEWSEAVDLFEPGCADEYTNKVRGGSRTYALRVQGESMTSPHGMSFPDGMLIHIDPDIKTEIGDYVIARLKGHDAVTFKQLKQDEATLYLKPLNPDHKAMYGEFEVLGKLVFAGWEF